MKTKRSVFDKVLTKLTAMRVTLSDEEREILDRIVLTAIPGEDEVEGHAAQPKLAQSKLDPQVDRGKTYPAADDDEVEGHAMMSKLTQSKLDPQVDRGKTFPAADDEVEGHAMKPKLAQSKLDPQVDRGKTFPAADDEVEGHAMKPRLIQNKQLPFQITFDAEKGRYMGKLTNEAAER